MTSFVIESGPIADDPLRFVPDWFRDVYAVEPEPRRVLHDYAYHLIGSMTNPKKVETVRKHVLSQWGFLQVLSVEHPEVFDEFWCAYAERVLSA